MEKDELRRFASSMIGWLLDSGICSKEGVVFSWLNEKKPGYPYPEISGYYIKFLSYLYLKFLEKKYLDKAIKCADNVSIELSKEGSVGKDGLKYVFDSAICFSGLIALAKIKKLSETQEIALKKSIDFFYNSVKQKEVIFKNGKGIVDYERWSLSYGSLLIKNAISLIEAYEYFGDNKYKSLAESMVRDLIAKTYKGDHFSINEKQPFVYTHCNCYATEGLFYLTSKGHREFSQLAMNSAQWLADNQNSDGSMYNWYLRNNVERDKQGDATSQATRIWLLADKHKFSKNIENATKFLKSLQHKSGGLYYNINSHGLRSEDINSWATIFAAQAVLWQIETPEREWIV